MSKKRTRLRSPIFVVEISIIIPAHDRPEFLAQTIVSCLIQTRKALELIVVDDGSSMDLQPVLDRARRFAPSETSLRLIRQPKAGAPAARNRGFQESRGAFIQFVDSDDLLHPEKLQKQAAQLEADPNLDMVFCLDEWFAENIGDLGLLWNQPNGEAEIDRFPWNDVVWQTGSPLWRRSALSRIGPWAEQLACWQDWELHVRALAQGIRYAHLQEVLQFIRDHPGPRITDGIDKAVRERSKFEAFRLGGKHLLSRGRLDGKRGDGLAMFLIHIAHESVLVKETRLARMSLWTAVQYARSFGIKATALAMLAASRLAQVQGKDQVNALKRSRAFVELYMKLPVRESRWKKIKSTRREEPGALIEVLRRM